jgi:hypothetical protein
MEECAAGFTELDAKEKGVMYKKLIEKTANARFKDEFSRYKDATTGRRGKLRAKHKTDTAFRLALKSLKGGKNMKEL